MEKHSKLTAKKVIIILGAVFAVCIAALVALALTRGNVVPATEEYGYVNPDETKASPDEGFVIDGVLDEAQYEKCNWLKLKNDEGGAGVDIAMTSFYGEKGMYFVYDITESSPIYVNLQRNSYMNSGIEMYLALDGVTSMATNKAFEIDLLPTGDMSFKQRTGRENWINVASSEDIMAYLGATTKGGAINTEECKGYNLELFIPWDYMDKLGMNADEMKKTFVYVNPVHITSYNYEGTNSSTDRYWYAFATQLGSDGWNDVAQYFRFGAEGVLGTVPVKLMSGDNYTISGNDSVIPGMKTSITIKPEDGYALNSILVNGKEYIKKVAYNEDGSVTLKIRGVKEGLTVSASAEKITEGNKTLSGVVAVHKLGGDTLEGVSISYKGPGGEKPIEFDNNGKFELKDLKQGYYIVTAEKKGYAPINRGIYVNRDMDIDLTLEYQMFEAESGYNWILDNQNDGILNRFGGSGKILSVDSYNKFKVDANFKYDKELAAKSDGDTFLQQRSGIQIKFSNGKYWRVNLMNENGVYKVQYAKHNTDTVFEWKTVHELSAKELAQYQSEEGIKLSVLRDGKYAWVCLNDKPVAIEVLDDEYAKCTAQIGFEGWIANQEIEEMEYNISTSFKNDLKNFYFTTSSKWDISRQLDGVVSLPGGGTEALKFYKQYADIDLTLKNVKEHDTTGKKPGRTDVLFEFDTNGDGKVDKSVSFGITCVDGKECWIQTLGNADNYIPATRIKGLYKLNKKQAEDYLKGDGVDFRVVRKGTDVYLFVDGEEVCIWDLTQNSSGVTANMKATVSLRHYDAKADTVEIPFTVTDKVENVEIKKIFKDNDNWDLTKQLEGIVSLPGGGTDTSLQFFKKYANIDVTVIAKENDSTGKTPGRTDILFEFDLNNDGTMDKNVSFGIVQLSNGSCKVQTLGWDKNFIPTKRINDLYELSYAEAKAYKNEGVELRVVRYGTETYVYVGDNQVAVFDLTQNESGVKADTKATISLRHYDAIASKVVIPFKVTDQVEKPKVEEAKEKIFKDNFKWELSKQLDGIVSLPEGGTELLEFCKQYADIDLTLKNVKEHDTTGKKPGRTDVLFEFDTNGDGKVDKSVSFGIACVDGKEYWVQTLGNADNYIPATRIKGLYKLNKKQAEDYLKGDGVDFRVVRKGTDVYLFVDGEEVCIWDLTQNNSGVTADMKAIVSLRHYDAKADTVEIPFTVTDKVEKVEIKKIFKDNENWDLTKQLEGIVSLPGGGTETSLQFFKKYANIDVAVTAKEHDTTGKKPGRTDILFEFDLNNDGEMDKNVSFGIVQLSNGSCKVQTLGWDKKFIPTERVNDLYELNYAETKAYKNEGVELRVVRYGTEAYVYVGENQVAVFDLTQNNSGVKANTEAIVGIRHYDATVANVVIPFKVTDQVEKPKVEEAKEKIFKDNFKWELSKQLEGIVSLPEGGDGDKLEFISSYKDIDLTLTARDYDDAGKTAARTDVLFVFENGAHVSFGITSDDTRAWIQSLNNGADDDKQIYDRWAGHGNLTSEELENYKADGVEFRIVRVGTDVLLYIDGRQVKIADLTNNNRGVTADMEANVFIRHYDDKGEYVEIPFSVKEETDAVAITDNSTTGKIVTDKKTYVIGDTVVLSGQFEGYYVSELKVNGKAVALNSDGTYTFKATENNYSVEGTFKKAIFKKNSAWNLLKQNQGKVEVNGVEAVKGVASLPGGKSNAVQFYEQYTDIDLTVTAKENAAAGAAKGRTDVLFEFENGKNISFGVVCTDKNTGECWVQVLNSANDTANAGKFIYNRGKGFHKLNADEIAKYNGEGIDLRIVRTGTVVYLFLDGKQVAACDLTVNNSGVTADTKATLSLRHYDAVADQVDIPFTVTKELSEVTITDNSQQGKVVTENASYVVGTEVVLSGELDGYYLTGLKVDGSDVTLDENGTYKFKATKDSYTVEGSFTEAVFVNNPNWKLRNQNQGTVEVNFAEAIKGVVTLPNGGNANNSNNLGGLKFKDKYTNIDLNLVVRDYDDSANSYARTDVLFEFDGGQTVSFGVTKTGAAGDEPNWTYRVQSMGCTLNNWKTLRDMTEDEIALYTGANGIDFRVLRNGTSFYVYLGGKLAKSYDFKDKISANTAATVTLRHYDDAGVQVDIPFTVADEVKSIFATAGASGGTWNIANQFSGSVSVNATGNTVLPLADKYTDIDLTVTAKENAAAGAARGRTDILFEFDTNNDGTMDKNISFGVLCTNVANGDYYVQSLNSANDTANAGKYIIGRGKGFYQLNADEIAKYNSDGIDFRIVRSGTMVYLFLDGRQVAVCDLTSNNSGVTANTKATVKLRHYDVKGNINFPFTVSNKVQEATVDITSSGNGTISKNKVYLNADRNNALDITKHFVGETIILTATPVSEEYECTKLLVNGKDVTADMVIDANGVGTYALKAIEKDYNVEATFAKPLIFSDDYNHSLWDASTQFEGYVSLPNGGGATASPLRFNKKYVDVDVSLVVRDYPYAGSDKEDARTEVGFVFDNGETVQFGVVKTGGLYRIQTRGNTIFGKDDAGKDIWRTPYFIEDQSLIDSYVITQEELNQDPSQENLGGLPFRIVRKGTEFYLYLGNNMVKGYDFSYKIAADTQVTVYLRHYDDQGGKVVIPFTVTDEVTIENPRLYTDKSEVTGYAYSFAVLPDTQIVTENDVVKGESNLAKIFDWIVANKDSKNIQYVFGLGDITENNNATEWTLAQTQHAKLTTAGIPYSAIRGNHDLAWYGKPEGADNYTDDYTAYMGTADYRAQFATGGFYSQDNISNSWRTFEVGDVKYLMLTLDYGPSDAVLNWASDVIYQHPDRNVIITTHAYLYRDGTTLDANDNVPPSTSGGVNDGDDMWDKLVSKHENIVLVMSGHDPSENIVVNKSTGDNGNVVTSMLIDAQDVERDEGSMGMVAMLYFSEDGKNMTVEYYSTAKEKYFKSENQFTKTLDVVEEENVVYGQGATFTDASAKYEIAKVLGSEHTPRTFEATIKLPVNLGGSRGGVIFGNFYSGNTGVINFEIQADGTPRLYYHNGGTVNSKGLGFPGVVVNTGKPVRVTIVVDTNEIRCYVDGKEVGTPISGNTSNYLSITSSVKHTIGNDLRTSSRETPRFKGEIYDISLWSDVRTPDEIAKSSIATIDTNDENLIAAYNFRAGYSASATKFNEDLSGNEYHLPENLNVGTSTTPAIGAYTKVSISKGTSYTEEIPDEHRKTLNATPYTVSAWVQLPTSHTGRAGVIFSNYKDGSTGNTVCYEIHENGKPRFFHLNSSKKIADLKFTNSNMDIRSDNAWTHLAYTVTGNKVICYVNGVKQEAVEQNNVIQLEAVSKNYLVGADLRDNNSQSFKGRILKLDLYEGILSADKIMKLYSEGANAVTAGKISY